MMAAMATILRTFNDSRSNTWTLSRLGDGYEASLVTLPKADTVAGRTEAEVLEAIEDRYRTKYSVSAVAMVGVAGLMVGYLFARS